MEKDKDLPSWDEVAGDPTTYENTYVPNGNTQVLMSMNVRPDLHGKELPRKLITSLQASASQMGVEHLIGSFRPNEYGKWKLQQLNENGTRPEFSGMTMFEYYCSLQREDGLPIDGWIRNLVRNGMTPIKEDSYAMVVEENLDTFGSLQNEYNPELWKQVPYTNQSDMVNWECGEVGAWTVNLPYKKAIYQEANLWGRIPLQIHEII